MARPLSFAVGLAIAVFLARAAIGCSSSSNSADGPDASGNATSIDTGTISDGGDRDASVPPNICAGGCLCFAVDACPQGCYIEQAFEPDGSAMPLFCGNGIATCGHQDSAWSFGDLMDNCGSGTPVYVDGGPDGSFCCETEVEDAAPEGGDAGVDASQDAGPADAQTE
jgi:hypothetical protein